ncbi:MAG: O-antigen ligase family protein, partial [Planctomycetes bacterium]|nr:O-antigen ligase family protein [Planctomycetota bacterium]
GARNLLLLFIAVLTATVLWAAFDLRSFPAEFDKARSGPARYVFDDLLNPLKYVIPAIILYDTCRTRRQLLIALLGLIGLTTAYALLVIKTMPLAVLFDDSDFLRHRHRIDRDTGLMAIDMSMVMAAGFWGTMCALRCWRTWLPKCGLVAAAGAMLLALGLCHSRGGYITWAVLGILFGVVRWRAVLVAAPVVVVAVFAIFPSVHERLTTGLDSQTVTGDASTDWHSVTAGRSTRIWPPVFEQFTESPLIGSGRRAILRTAAYDKILETDGVVPDHPHNAYLELLVDAGILGFLPAMCLYGGIAVISIRLFRRARDPILVAVGGTSMACVVALMVASLGCQSFFPTQSTLGFWAAWALALRGRKDTCRNQAPKAPPLLQPARVPYVMSTRG